MPLLRSPGRRAVIVFMAWWIGILGWTAVSLRRAYNDFRPAIEADRGRDSGVIVVGDGAREVTVGTSLPGKTPLGFALFALVPPLLVWGLWEWRRASQAPVGSAAA